MRMGQLSEGSRHFNSLRLTPIVKQQQLKLNPCLMMSTFSLRHVMTDVHFSIEIIGKGHVS
jgi:hypothetical protein